MVYPDLSSHLDSISDKPSSRRSRSMFRLFRPADHSHVQHVDPHCFSHYDPCCGLRLTAQRDIIYDHLSTSHPSDTRAITSSHVPPSPEILLSLTRARQSSPYPPGAIADDFDYDHRRDSNDDDTLSLSDAHPSVDAIAEPEAIGDQLLSPPKEPAAPRVNSAFDIAPLWQRLKRVDELDAVDGARNTFLAKDSENRPARVRYFQPKHSLHRRRAGIGISHSRQNRHHHHKTPPPPPAPRPSLAPEPPVEDQPLPEPAVVRDTHIVSSSSSAQPDLFHSPATIAAIPQESVLSREPERARTQSLGLLPRRVARGVADLKKDEDLSENETKEEEDGAPVALQHAVRSDEEDQSGSKAVLLEDDVDQYERMPSDEEMSTGDEVAFAAEIALAGEMSRGENVACVQQIETDEEISKNDEDDMERHDGVMERELVSTKDGIVKNETNVADSTENLVIHDDRLTQVSDSPVTPEDVCDDNDVTNGEADDDNRELVQKLGAVPSALVIDEDKVEPSSDVFTLTNGAVVDNKPPLFNVEPEEESEIEEPAPNPILEAILCGREAAGSERRLGEDQKTSESWAYLNDISRGTGSALEGVTLLESGTESSGISYEESEGMAMKEKRGGIHGMRSMSAPVPDHLSDRASVADLDLDPLCLPSHEDYSVAPCAPIQGVALPVAGVYYGNTSTAIFDSIGNLEGAVRRKAGQGDYPEYEVLKGGINEDSIFGSEPNTPVMGMSRLWREPFSDCFFDMAEDLEEAREIGRAFQDRGVGQPVPEVLLHDWSGSTPVEPNVEMVDSAPNSRSSGSQIYRVTMHARDFKREFPNAAALLARRGGADEESGEQSVGERRLDGSEFCKSEMGSKQEERHGSTGKSVDDGLRVVAEGKEGDGWGCSDCGSRGDLEQDSMGKESSQAFFPSLPSGYAADEKLQDFQLTVERKSFSEAGYRRGGVGTNGGGRGRGQTGRGRSFVEFEGRGTECYDDVGNFVGHKEGGQTRLLGFPQRRRRASNVETSSDGVSGAQRAGGAVQQHGGKRGGVVGRLFSGMHLAKKLVSQN